MVTRDQNQKGGGSQTYGYYTYRRSANYEVGSPTHVSYP